MEVGGILACEMLLFWPVRCWPVMMLLFDDLGRKSGVPRLPSMTRNHVGTWQLSCSGVTWAVFFQLEVYRFQLEELYGDFFFRQDEKDLGPRMTCLMGWRPQLESFQP